VYGGMQGHNTASQGIFSIPQDVPNHQYYIIHAGGVGSGTAISYYYTKYNSQTQQVSDKNTLLQDPTKLGNEFKGTEAISVLPKCGDSTFWMLIPRYNGLSTSITEFSLFNS